MAGVGFIAKTAEIATGVALKTLLQVVAAANHAVLVKEWSISFKGVSTTGTPILVEFLRQTTAGTMTALTLVKDPDDTDETLQATAQHTATVEPTAGDVLDTKLVHPQTGYTWQAPFGGMKKIGGGDRMALRVTADASINAVASMVCEE